MGLYLFHLLGRCPVNFLYNQDIMDWKILLNMLQGAPNCQYMLREKVVKKICSDLIFCQNVTKILLKLTNPICFPLHSHIPSNLVISHLS